ncbi:hypothetical protein ACI39V_27720, partial [Klebsiella pneumoniae]
MNRPDGFGRLFVIFGALFSLAMLAMGAIVFVVVERTVETRIDRALQHHDIKYLTHGARRATTA